MVLKETISSDKRQSERHLTPNFTLVHKHILENIFTQCTNLFSSQKQDSTVENSWYLWTQEILKVAPCWPWQLSPLLGLAGFHEPSWHTSPRSEIIHQDQEVISDTLCQSFGSETGLVWFGPEISGPDGRLSLHYFWQMHQIVIFSKWLHGWDEIPDTVKKCQYASNIDLVGLWFNQSWRAAKPQSQNLGGCFWNVSTSAGHLL